MFWAVLFGGLVVIGVGLPVGDDANTMAVLQELETFKAGFPREKLEQDLLTHAALQGVVQPADVITAAEGPGVPPLALAEGALAITPRAALELRTLGQVEALTHEEASLQIALVEPKALGRSVGWRLARLGGERYEVQSIVLTAQAASPEAAALEPQVAEARIAQIDADKALAAATAKHERAEGLWEARRKWKAPWKSIARANEKRLEARTAMNEAQQHATQAKAQYEQLAKQALAFKPSGQATEVGVAKVRLSQQAGSAGAANGKEVELLVPVPLEMRMVPVPHLTGADFATTRQSGLWDSVKDGTVDEAIAKVDERFSWHYAHVELGGFKVGGMTALQLSPLLLLVLLPTVRRRASRVGAGYNPFDGPALVDLPHVGLGSRALNGAALIGLPLIGCVLCTLSLIQLSRVPVVPLLCALGVVMTGAFAQTALSDLLELRDAVLRSHSNPPPPKAA